MIVGLFLSTLFSQINYAQILLKEIPLKQQVENSSLIIEGKVISKKSFKNSSNGLIYTANTVEVYKVFKGEAVAILEVITAGGTIGLSAQIVTPSLKLYNNDIGIFMLNESDIKLKSHNNSYRNQFLPYGSLQGFYKYNLKNDLAVNPFKIKKGIAFSFYNEIKSYTKTQYIEMNNFDVLSIQSDFRKANSQPPSSITFTPSTVSAGTKTELIIDGSGFGGTQGTVSFSNADDGGATFVDALDTQVISWNDAQIKVEVPSEAGTGQIQVTDSGSASATSAASLTVSYSEINVTSDAVSSGVFVAYKTQHVDDNSSGGYTWQMFTDFDSNTLAKDAFVSAFNTWVCESKINWVFGSTTATDVTANDGINIVRFDNGSELPNGVLGTCYYYISGCLAGGGTTANWFVEELDIVFDDATSWYYGAGLPAISEYDFESVALHELGHGHQLGHTIDTSFDGDNLDDVMHYAISNSEQQRVLTTNNITAANNVQARSSSLSVCSQASMTDASCPLSVAEEELKMAITIFPNPAKGQFYIKNESFINLEKVVVYDLSGRLISKQDISNNSIKNTINLYNVSKGLYFVNIYSDIAHITKKIVIE